MFNLLAWTKCIAIYDEQLLCIQSSTNNINMFMSWKHLNRIIATTKNASSIYCCFSGHTEPSKNRCERSRSGVPTCLASILLQSPACTLQEYIGNELAMLVKKFHKFSKKNRFGKSSRSSSRNDEASTRDHKKRTCHKCKKPGHYIRVSSMGQWDQE